MFEIENKILDHPGEAIIEVVDKHWIKYLVGGIVGAISLFIPFIALSTFLFNQPEPISKEMAVVITLLSSIYLIIWLSTLFFLFIDEYLDLLIITGEKIVVVREEGLFRKTIDSVHLKDIISVNVDVKGIFPSWLDYGNLIITSGDEKAVIEMENIPHPHRVSRKIMELHQHFMTASNQPDSAPEQHHESVEHQSLSNIS